MEAKEKLGMLVNLLDRSIEYCDDEDLVKEAIAVSAACSSNEIQMTMADAENTVCQAAPLLTRFVPWICQSMVNTLKLDKTREKEKHGRLKRIILLLRSLLHGIDEARENDRYLGPELMLRQGSQVAIKHTCKKLKVLDLLFIRLA